MSPETHEKLLKLIAEYEKSQISPIPENMDKMEGFWYSKMEPYFPMPKENPISFPRKEEILKAYDKVIQRALVKYYRGSSTCRCCKAWNGSKEFEFKGWKWPEGYRHYIDIHNVIPTKRFMENVLNIKNFI
jgi:hypothetical protein